MQWYIVLKGLKGLKGLFQELWSAPRPTEQHKRYLRSCRHCTQLGCRGSIKQPGTPCLIEEQVSSFQS